MPPRLSLWTTSVRDSFIILLPLTLFGVVATLLGNLPVPAARRLLAQVLGSGWQVVAGEVVQATYGVFGLALAVVLAVQLARRLPCGDGQQGLPPMTVAIAALLNFMLCVATRDGFSATALSHASMLMGIAVGIATPELLRLLVVLQAKVRVPSLVWLRPVRQLAQGHRPAPGGVGDPVFRHAMRQLPLLAACGAVVMFVAQAGSALPAVGMRWLAGLTTAINAWLPADWLLTPAAVLANQAMWFVGIGGGKVLDQRAQALFGPAGAPYDPTLAWRPLMDTFVHLGGSGATLGLVLALFIASRSGPHRFMAKASLLPSVFNINELLVFGLPLALNPTFLLPFVLAPLALAGLALVAVHSGLVPLANASVPWTMPPLMSGYLLSGSWRGVALQAVGLLASTLIYLPFARRAEAQRVCSQAQAFAAAITAIAHNGHRRVPTVRRSDQVGLIARDLLASLAQDMGRPGLALAYQPKHDRQGDVVGVEALLRWTHATFGPIRADVAVTLAEDGGLIRRLGAWVLDEACARKAQWNALGLQRITMAVNVSPLQLGDPALPDMLAACLARHGLKPAEIGLEITESHAIPTQRVVDDNLARIVAMGVPLAMDDFGMGYSSLLHLRRFRAQAIKIDGSLTRDVLTNPISGDIIRTITALGRSQQLEVVAEFVETAEQRDALAEMGCDVFQGYLYSPALPGPACAEYLLSHAVRRVNRPAKAQALA